MHGLEPVGVAILLATVANRIVEALIVPVWERYALDKFWLMYVAWLVAGCLVGLSGVNLFENLPLAPLVGQILTAIVAGGGANFIADVMKAASSNRG